MISIGNIKNRKGMGIYEDFFFLAIIGLNIQTEIDYSFAICDEEWSLLFEMAQNNHY